MKLKTNDIDGTPVLELAGRFDAHTVSQVKEWIVAQNVGKPYLVIDLYEVTFIDSAALATLVQGMKQCRERGGDLVLANLAQPVLIIFELTRLDQAFEIYESLSEAVAGKNVESAAAA
jgi:anti-sigma B factor antagonist